MSKEPGSSVQKVQQTLKTLGFSGEVVVFPDSTRTASEAAQAARAGVAIEKKRLQEILAERQKKSVPSSR